MARNRQANWEKWVQGELVASLQAKGKLPKQHTAASEYKEKAYSNTGERIFPVTGEDAQDMTAVLMAEARQKLATAQAKQHSQQLLQQQQQKAAQHLERSPQNKSSKERAELKARIAAMQQELKQEASSCSSLQQAIAAVKKSG
ncbi:hypothetical protein OEZ85_002466 [Tetradesmus obliquus]|uniref:Uncharacterized protein n=1 Tax=Tetradesmus obliquus TaxID=3088 RepID=A0ABY8TYE4_TETOB|nr:hypothetical protein OEZ85_002466 [Tetradesmus obliquus]